MIQQSHAPAWRIAAFALAHAIRDTGKTRGAYYGLLHAHATDLDRHVGKFYSAGWPEMQSLESMAAYLENGATQPGAAMCAVTIQHLCFDNLDEF